MILVLAKTLHKVKIPFSNETLVAFETYSTVYDHGVKLKNLSLVTCERKVYANVHL